MADVTVYTTATCGYCKMEKSYLQSKGVQFKEKKADEDPNLARELMEKSGQMGVPFTIIKTDDGNEEKILGFDKHRLDQALSLA